MKPELLNQLKTLRGKEVVVTYGKKPVEEVGTLVSYTTGRDSTVWLERKHSDISIPTLLIHSVKEQSKQ